MRHAVPLFLSTLLPLAPTLPAQDGGSTFGHARTRELAELGRLPTPLDVAVADVVNYHRHRLPLPRGDDEVFVQLRYGNEMVVPGGQVILQFGYTTAPADDRADLPPLNLALVIDRSGSMNADGKLDRVQQGLRTFVGRLRAKDRVALISYSDDVTVDRESRDVADGRWLLAAIDALQAGGATNLHAGLMAGLRQVQSHARTGGSNRVLLLTDGIANRGTTDPEAILAATSPFTQEDIDLSTIGVGQDLDTRLLDRLARGGRGLFHFVADARDIDKVFAREHAALTTPVARNVVLTIDLPRELHLEQIFGHTCERLAGDEDRGERLRLKLPNLNRDVTAVVMLTCRADSDLAAGQRPRVRANLQFATALTGQPRYFGVDEAFDVVTSPQAGLRDPEVRKNFTIATLAQGMHEMAVLAQDRRWTQADEALQQALRFAREQFRSDDEPDVAGVRATAEDYARVLRRYVDRFRDF
ncbi:MAG: VWA domain-containing protein [Planctomycetes bacterium]|nr:VWA domain-containing protein [Planctomycetota bacterium]